MKVPRVQKFQGSVRGATSLCSRACNQRPPGSERHHRRRPQLPNSLDPRSAATKRRSACTSWCSTTCSTLDEKLASPAAWRPHWEQPNPLTYVVHLRRGVRFHDGHELTADDVVHTFGSFIDPAFVSPRKGAYRMLDRVEAVASVHRPLHAQGTVRLIPDSAGDAGRAQGRRAGASRPADRHGSGPVCERRRGRTRHARIVSGYFPRRSSEWRRGAEGGARRDHAGARAAQRHRGHGGQRPLAGRGAPARPREGRDHRRSARHRLCLRRRQHARSGV